MYNFIKETIEVILVSYSKPTCYIHPNREAVDRCERCKQMVCVECKTKYRSFGGMDRADDIYIYCPPCYNVRQQRAKTLGKIICPLFIIFFVIVVAIIILGALNVFAGISNFPEFP